MHLKTFLLAVYGYTFSAVEVFTTYCTYFVAQRMWAVHAILLLGDRHELRLLFWWQQQVAMAAVDMAVLVVVMVQVVVATLATESTCD